MDAVEAPPTCLQQTRLLVIDAKVALDIREDTWRGGRRKGRLSRQTCVQREAVVEVRLRPYQPQ